MLDPGPRGDQLWLATFSLITAERRQAMLPVADIFEHYDKPPPNSTKRARKRAARRNIRFTYLTIVARPRNSGGSSLRFLAARRLRGPMLKDDVLLGVLANGMRMGGLL